MFSNTKIDEQIHQTAKKMKEIAITMERLEREYNEMLEELQLTPEALSNYMTNEDNFTAEELEEIQQNHKQLDEQLKLELSRVNEPLKAKKNMNELGSIQHYWISAR